MDSSNQSYSNDDFINQLMGNDLGVLPQNEEGNIFPNSFIIDRDQVPINSSIIKKDNIIQSNTNTNIKNDNNNIYKNNLEYNHNIINDNTNKNTNFTNNTMVNNFTPDKNIHDFDKGQILFKDRFLPLANVNRIMKESLPEEFAKISKDGKELMKKYSSEFISFVTSKAKEVMECSMKKTLTSVELIVALEELGFERHSELTRIYLTRYSKIFKASDEFLYKKDYGCTNNERTDQLAVEILQKPQIQSDLSKQELEQL